MAIPSLPHVLGYLRALSATCLAETVFVARTIAGTAQALLPPHDEGMDIAAGSDRHAPLVVLVHGFAGSKTTWSRLRHALREHDVSIATFGYTPFGSSIDELVGELGRRLDQLIASSDPSRVVLVGHSLGGVLAVRALANDQLAARVDVVVTIGAPFGGSPWAGFLPIPGIVSQLRANSPSLRQLRAIRIRPGARWLSLTSPSDMVVPASRSELSTVPMEQISVDGVGHCAMLQHPLVVDRIVAASRGVWEGGDHQAAA